MKNVSVIYLKLLVFGGEVFYIFEQACFRNEWNIRTRIKGTWYTQQIFYHIIAKRDTFCDSLFTFLYRNAVKPRYTDTRYNKNRYNDYLTGTKYSLIR